MRASLVPVPVPVPVPEAAVEADAEAVAALVQACGRVAFGNLLVASFISLLFFLIVTHLVVYLCLSHILILPGLSI